MTLLNYNFFVSILAEMDFLKPKVDILDSVEFNPKLNLENPSFPVAPTHNQNDVIFFC
jgi:hypothetical protein